MTSTRIDVLKRLGLHAALAVAYAVLHLACIRVACLPPGNIGLFGLAAGVAAVGMIHLGRSFAASLLIASLVAHALSRGPVVNALEALGAFGIAGSALLDAFQALLCRFFYRRNVDQFHPFATRAGVARFALFVVLLPPVLVGWVRLAWYDNTGIVALGAAQFLYQFFKMVSADIFGVILAVPAYAALREAATVRLADHFHARFGVRLALLLEFAFLAFSWHEVFLFFTMPIMLWITVADRLVGVASAMVLLSLGALAGTAAGYGPFYSGTHHGYVKLVAFLTSWNLPFLFTHGLMEELHAARERLADQVSERTAELRRTLRELASKHEELTMRNVELQEAESELLVAKEKAEAASRAKSMHLSRMSHELRTPLNAIAGFCGLIGMKTGPGGMAEETRRYFEHIETASTRLTELIGNILDLAKIEEGRIEVVLDTVDVRSLVRNILAINQSASTIKSIRLTSDLADNLAPGVVTDGDKLHKIVMNLVSNAVKFTPPGGSVALRAGMIGRELVIVVVDTGPGIPADRLERIFEPFVQADATVSQKFGGTGLGLSIAKQMAQLLGGVIAVESEPGKGTTFTVTIPAVLAPAAGRQDGTRTEDSPGNFAGPGDPWAPSPGSAHGAASIPSPRDLKGTYLVVDDEAVNRKVMSDWLEMGQTLVDVAADGASALKRLGALMAHGRRPDAILLDLHLPDVDGIEVAKRIQSDLVTTGIPILIITADVTSDTQARCRAAGVHEVLTKPVDLDFLARLLLAIERGN